jgi:methionine-rich copper-binding protein CopC
MPMNRLRRAAAVITAPLLLLAAGQAQAHAHLSKAAPAANATVAAPAMIQLQFNEKLAPKFSGVQLMRNDTGANVEVVSTVAPKDAKSLQARPKTPLSPGSYMVMWFAVGPDGHRMAGDYNFTVK